MNSYSNFENIIFNLNGIIYGGYIRDKIISTDDHRDTIIFYEICQHVFTYCLDSLVGDA